MEVCMLESMKEHTLSAYVSVCVHVRERESLRTSWWAKLTHQEDKSSTHLSNNHRVTFLDSHLQEWLVNTKSLQHMLESSLRIFISVQNYALKTSDATQSRDNQDEKMLSEKYKLCNPQYARSNGNWQQKYSQLSNGNQWSRTSIQVLANFVYHRVATESLIKYAQT